CAKCDEEKAALEIASRLQREFREAGQKIDNLQSEKTALERQIAAADERIAQLQRELQTARDQFAKEATELGAFEAAKKQTTFREEELTEKINQHPLPLPTHHHPHQ